MSCDRASANAEPLVADRIAKVSALADHAGVGALLISDRATMRWLGAGGDGDSELMICEGEGRILCCRDGNRDECVAPPLPAPGGWPQISIPDRVSTHDDPCVELGEAIAAARAVKDAEELALISAAAELVDAGHQAVREAVEPGLSERELWQAGFAAIEAASLGAADAVVDLMVGQRTALIGEPPGEAIVHDGDPVLFDLAPERDGYWADSCATFVCGSPSEALRERHAVITAALEVGLGCARPGVSAGAVDRAIRDHLAAAGLKCPHHTGHGVGICAQEPPWFVPGNGFVLQQGMVVALEPGVYSNGFGVRLEHLAVVEPDGARPLTKHPLNLTRER